MPVNHTHKAELVRVVDGDTVKMKVDCDFHIAVTETFRLARIDTPEMNTAEGRKAKEFVIQWFFDHDNIILKSEKPLIQDRYGRWLAEIYGTDKLNGIQSSLNQDLLDSDNARNYGS